MSDLMRYRMLREPDTNEYGMMLDLLAGSDHLLIEAAGLKTRDEMDFDAAVAAQEVFTLSGFGPRLITKKVLDVAFGVSDE